MIKTHVIDFTNDYNTTIYAAARNLLADGANPEDRIETYRNAKLSMSGIIGQMAKLTVVQNKDGLPSLQLVRWRPFLASSVPSETAQDEILGS